MVGFSQIQRNEEETYKCLLQPLQVGRLMMKNRLFISAHSYGFFNVRGLPTDKMLYYVLERARGGAALLILGETLVNSASILDQERWGACFSCDELIPFYQELSESVKPFKMKLYEQLFHPGGQVWPEPGAVAFAPSSIAHVISGLIPAELNIVMIKGLIQEFGLAAKRAKIGGLDGVELKCDQGKLHHQFLSPYYNRRSDHYGGSFENRLHFILETLECIRYYVGSDFTVGVRIAGDTFPPDESPIKDLTIDDAKQLSHILANSGLIDYISVNGATNSNPHGYWQSHGDETVPSANFTPLAYAIKKEIQIPVFVASRISEVTDAARVIMDGCADMVAMTRSHIADSDIILKLQEGLIKDIRPCILCNQSCIGNTWLGRELRCIHNPRAGHESEFPAIAKVANAKRIVVVGGGPAGMEAARVAANRGHEVILCEKSDVLGGQTLIAARAAHRQRFAEVAKYLESQLFKLPNVQVKLGCQVSSADVVNLKPDHVILATGSVPILPEIQGANQPNSFTIDQVLQTRNFKSGDNVVIVDEDWHLHALSLADLLTDEKVKVTLVTTQEFAGKGLDIVNLTSFHSRLAQKKVNIMTWTEICCLSADTVVARNILTGEKQELKIAGIVFVVNRQPNCHLLSELRGIDMNVTCVGDCLFPRGLEVAILEGHKAGLLVPSLKI